MDYEKAYKDALERVRELALAGKVSADDILNRFPELRESEDERARRWIYELVTCLGDPADEDAEKELDEMRPLALSWLEKQKYPEDIIGKAMSYFGAESLLDNANGLSDFEKFTAWLYCEFLRGLPKKLNQEYIKEQTKVILDEAQKELCKMPNSTELIEMWDAEKAMLQEKDFRGDTWRIAQNAFMDGFARGTCVKFERQKEQKPEVEICPHSIKSKSYKENGYPIEDCDYGLEIAYDILEKTFGEVRGYQTDDGIREHQIAIEAVRKAKEQKPALVPERIRPKFAVGDTICRPMWSDHTIQEIYIHCNDPVYVCVNEDGTESHIPMSEQDEWEQKEQKPDIEAKLKEEYKRGWDNALLQLPEEVDSQIWQIANNSAKTWEQGFAILMAAKKAFDKGKAEGLKEQKPAEKQDYSGLNDLERAIHRGFLCAGVENVPVEIIKETAKECLAQMKPAEWSEVELTFRGENVTVKRPFYRDDKGRGYSTTEQDEIVAWNALRAWCEKKGVSLYDLYPNTKWSEEDEKMRWDLINAFTDKNNSKVSEFMQLRATKADVIDWLKSLRPSWKPSEEQMKHLERCFLHGHTVGLPNQHVLESLYNDLKKLM